MANRPVMGNRVHALLGSVCKWAAKLGTIPANPMLVVDRPSKETSRERVLSDAEIGYVWKATENERPTLRAAVRLLALLGQRMSETVLGLRWDNVDLDADLPVWTIPGVFRKGGLVHVVPLPKMAVEIIEALRPVTGSSASGCVLDGVPVRNFTWWGGPDGVRDRVIDLARADGVDVAHFTRHDLRRTMVTGMTSLGVAPFVADLVVGHVVGSKVSRTYNRNQYLNERASALNAWAAHVAQVVSGEKRRKADVLPYEARA
jgi:integrase